MIIVLILLHLQASSSKDTSFSSTNIENKLHLKQEMQFCKQSMEYK